MSKPYHSLTQERFDALNDSGMLQIAFPGCPITWEEIMQEKASQEVSELVSSLSDVEEDYYFLKDNWVSISAIKEYCDKYSISPVSAIQRYIDEEFGG